MFVLVAKAFQKEKCGHYRKLRRSRQYIKEHIKGYYVDGKAPKRSKLEAISQKLKANYKALVTDNKAFLTMKQAASQYTRTVRT